MYRQQARVGSASIGPSRFPRGLLPLGAQLPFRGLLSCASRATGPSSERSSGPRGCRETILCSGSERGLWSLTAWVLLLALPLTGCVTLGQSLTFPCFRFPAK